MPTNSATPWGAQVVFHQTVHVTPDALSRVAGWLVFVMPLRRHKTRLTVQLCGPPQLTGPREIYMCYFYRTLYLVVKMALITKRVREPKYAKKVAFCPDT